MPAASPNRCLKSNETFESVEALRFIGVMGGLSAPEALMDKPVGRTSHPNSARCSGLCLEMMRPYLSIQPSSSISSCVMERIMPVIESPVFLVLTSAPCSESLSSRNPEQGAGGLGLTARGSAGIASGKWNLKCVHVIISA
ncbi:hypothetical protein J5N58_24525 [Rhizobium cremeum]|uniref:hypothetical protein n=1 Tax=Rhizobium cremeum TaxID=2813827 RepID=UPI001FD095D9|nr:hypothetical protein [Rhizobium cremeum]MCJ7997759.1 hypothetical protein [Rhizobium cremeum]MCJ8002853.1 hypothetical protein [Rhizobium cremeum]